MKIDDLKEKVFALGAKAVAVMDTDALVPDPSFRALCEQNRCGMYKKCWMCPPDVGAIEDLIEELATYPYALVYQTVFPLEDSFDVEGMIQGKKNHAFLSQQIHALLSRTEEKVLHLGAGGCGVCKTCAREEEKPCRFPEKAIASLEAYGIQASKLATIVGMPYQHGPNTVTYFGAVFFGA